MFDKLGDWLIALVYVAGIFVLVRPGSQGPAFVTAIGNSMSALVNASTGGGGWAAGGE